MLLYPSVPALDEHCNLFGITATAHHPDALPLAMHFLHDANRGTSRFIQFLLHKHTTKVALILQDCLTKGKDFLGNQPSKMTYRTKRGDPKRETTPKKTNRNPR